MTQDQLTYATARAIIAIKNGRTKALKKSAAGDFAGAEQTYLAAMATTQKWLDGTHPVLQAKYPKATV